MSINYKLRLIDIVVLVFFIFAASAGIYMFRQDLMQTMDARDMEPAGVIIVRNNIVQRRHADRVLWDRIYVDSPVYPGDLIRAAELSSTNIDIDNNEIFLNENTLIRIQQSMGSAGNFLVELREGNLSVTSSPESSGIMLDLMGSQVQASSGAVLNLEVGEEGIAVQVSEGKADFIQEGQTREIQQGAMIALDTQGAERLIPAAVVMSPVSNARYLNNSKTPIQVNFLWNRINLEEADLLRLEIAGDVGFTTVFHTVERLNDSALVSFTAGRWFWRLYYEDSILNRGQITIVDSFETTLISPVTGSLFRYQNTLPQMRFQWTETEGASGYLIQINKTQDFSDPLLTRESTGASLVLSQLEEGAWYWRVKPVFPVFYEGESSFSTVSLFRIEKTADIAAPAVEIPVIPVTRTQVAVTTPVIQNQNTQSPVSRNSEAVSRPQRNIVSARRSHTVRPGETLGMIAWEYYNDFMQWSRITRANNIENPDMIYPGQVFVIP